MINSYQQFFAGTYFYALKVQNRGKMSEGVPFAMSAILFIATSEGLLLAGLSLVWSGGAVLANIARDFSTAGALLIVNYLLFVNRGKYIGIVRRYERQRRRLLRVAMVIHAIAISTFFVPAFLIIAHVL
ncbi:MAG: hypothetical protein WAU56_00820 [Steroidobacteraceae bacterium]